MVPTWNALPLWAKIILAPILFVSIGVTVIFALRLLVLAVIGVATVIGGMIAAAKALFRWIFPSKSKLEVVPPEEIRQTS